MKALIARSFSAIKRNFLLIILSLSSLITILPILKVGIFGIFYHVDPDVVYVGNAISYIKSHMIHFWGHPGTPSILLLAWSYWPLRIYAKIVEHQPFVSWSFENFRFLFAYSRFLYQFIFTLSFFIYLKAVKILTKSQLVLIFTWISLFLFAPFFDQGVKIAAENTAFFIVSLWLLSFSLFTKTRKVVYLFLLALLSGVAFAVKFNLLTLAIATFLIAYFSNNQRLREKIILLFFIVSAAVTAFLLVTKPISASYKPMFSRFFRVAERSGGEGAHGYGPTSFVDFNEYKISITNFFKSNTWSSFIVIYAIVGTLFLFLKRKLKFMDPVFLLFLSVLVGSLAILKYPLPYYQFPNYLVFIFLGSLIFDKLKTQKQFLLIVLLLIPVHGVISSNLNHATNNALSARMLEKDIQENPAIKATLWDYGPARDFAYLWVRSWSGRIFSDEIVSKRADLLELDIDFERVYINNYYEPVNIWDICWDKLYIRKKLSERFMEKYSEKNLVSHEVDDSGTVIVESDHCFK